MIFEKTAIAGVYMVHPEPRTDHRGYFERIYCVDEFKKQGIDFPIAQMNRSKSLKKGTIRGLHMQQAPHAEDKLVSCIAGEVFDVAVDMRPESKTFGKWLGTVLNLDNQKMMYLPKGIAHGIQALCDDAIIQYPVSAPFAPASAVGWRWDDPFFAIDWPIRKDVTVSDIDASWPFFQPTT